MERLVVCYEVYKINYFEIHSNYKSLMSYPLTNDNKRIYSTLSAHYYNTHTNHTLKLLICCCFKLLKYCFVYCLLTTINGLLCLLLLNYYYQATKLLLFTLLLTYC